MHDENYTFFVAFLKNRRNGEGGGGTPKSIQSVEGIGCIQSWLFSITRILSPLPFFLISSHTNTIIISRLHFVVVVFVDIMCACRNRFIPHFHADVILYPVNMC